MYTHSQKYSKKLNKEDIQNVIKDFSINAIAGIVSNLIEVINMSPQIKMINIVVAL